MLNNPLVDFQEAMRAAGVFLAADAHITPDGHLHRARAADDKAGALSIWYNFHPDAPASGAAGNWRTGARLTWCGKRLQALTASERALLSQRIEEDKRRAQEATEARHRDAAAKAARIWTDAAPASPRHPYLLKKQIAPGVARQSGGALVLPIVDFTGTLHGLQFIAEDGGKRFISGMAKQGHFIPSGGTPSPDRPLWIAEGHATACTLRALQPGVVVIAACDAGNLLSVATEARKRWSGIDLVVCPDFDAIGRQKGQEAAIAARARILPLPADLPASCTDWNDWSAWRQEVAHG
ncbi:MAG: toprim domain-containing protein [Acidithiobacillus sp.]|jgi:putative DNA primase/helicase|uniref:toprim domain-containing protein n=2 Tax=Acidithiobacillus sp. TaxID=1872118 RepID=UPI00355E3C6B